MTVVLNSSIASEEEKARAEKELPLRRAEAMQTQIKECSDQAKAHPDQTHTITVDLQDIANPKTSQCHSILSKKSLGVQCWKS